MSFYEGIETGNGAENGTPSGGALFVRVESSPVALLRPTPFCGPQVEARLVVLLANTALWLCVVTWLVIDVTEIAAIEVQVWVFNTTETAQFGLKGGKLNVYLRPGGLLPLSWIDRRLTSSISAGITGRRRRNGG